MEWLLYYLINLVLTPAYDIWDWINPLKFYFIEFTHKYEYMQNVVDFGLVYCRKESYNWIKSIVTER